MILSALGTAMITASVVGLVWNRPSAILKRQLQSYLFASKLDDTKIRRIYRRDNSMIAEIVLPLGLTVEKFKQHISGIEQATDSHVRLRHLYGSTVELAFGFAPFYPEMKYTDKLKTEGLKVPLFTPFGIKNLDFRDETNCHLLVGGATRMGKSAFLRFLATHLIDANDGRIEIFFIDHKITDLYPFKNIPNVHMIETNSEARVAIRKVQNEIARRKELLKRRGNVVDIAEYRKRYPDESIDPIFVIIDEYGRFSDDEVIQEIVTEIAETAGYVDVHLIIASQRPDAKDVLKPRIKANIVTRMSFATSDETNSKIILDLPDAAHIGRIQGRAILYDGFPELVQVPYMSPEQATAILDKYRRTDYESERPTLIETAEALPGFIAGSAGFTDLS